MASMFARGGAFLALAALARCHCGGPTALTTCEDSDQCPAGYHCDPVARLCLRDDGGAVDAAALERAHLDRLTRDSARDASAAPDRARPEAGAHDDNGPGDATRSDQPDADATLPDTASAVDATLPCPGAPPSGVLCPSSDPMLAACYTFDGDADNGNGTWLVIDSSSHGNHGAGSGYSYTEGRVGMALALAGAGSVVVQDSPSLDVTPSMTLEAWVWLQAYPSSGRMAVLDNNGQYGLFVYAGDPPVLRCSAGSQVLSAPAPALQRWLHVACVNDDEAAERRILIDGAVVATGPASAPLVADTTALDLGANSPDHTDNWNCRIDQLRVWNGVRTDAELCWEARR